MSAEPSMQGPSPSLHLPANLAVLRRRNPALAKELESLPEPEGVEILTARHGGLTLRYRGRYVHSPFAPGSEIEPLLEEALREEPDWVICFGMGLGHGVEALRRRGRARIVVIEPELPILRAVLARLDRTALLKDERLFLLQRPHDLSPHFWAHHRIGDRIEFVVQPVYRELFEPQLLELMNKIKLLLNDAMGGKRAQLMRGRAWLAHTLDNLPRSLRRPTLTRLQGAFEGKPGILVSAGPSLGKNIDQLAELRGKALIVCVGTALLALLRKGIVPDLVLAIESEDIRTQFDADLSGVRLALAPHVHPSLFDLRTRKTFLISQNANPAGVQIAAELGAPVALRESGTVATTGFSCMGLLGCDPLILVGQDLAYSGGRQYAPGTLFDQMRYTLTPGGTHIEQHGLEAKLKIHAKNETARAKIKNDLVQTPIYSVRGQDGSLLPTTGPFLTSLHWFESVAIPLRAQGRTLINATEGGAFISGFEHRTLASVLETLPENAVDPGILDRLEPLPDARRRIQEMLICSQGNAEQIEEEARKAESLAHQAQKALGSPESDAPMEELGQAELNIRKLCVQTPMLDLLVQKALLTVRDRIRPETAADNLGSLRLSLDQTRLLLGALHGAAHELKHKIGECLERLAAS